MRLFDGITNFFGGGTPPAYQPPQNIQNFMQAIPVSEMQKVDAYQKLLGDKQGYANASRAMDLLSGELSKPDLTDTQRQEIAGDIKKLQQERDAYARHANDTRNAATAIGLDVSDYGKEKSLQESAQALQNYKSVAVRDFLNLPTLDELEENRYRELRSQGASPGMANRILGRERDKMQNQLMRRYADAMTTYGTNPDGTLDQTIGIPLLARMLPETPQTAQLFASTFATPLNLFNANNDAVKMAAQSDMLDRRLEQQAAIEAAKEKAKRQNLLDTLDRREKLTKFQEAQQNYRSDSTNKTRTDIANAGNQTRIDIANADNQTRADIANANNQTQQNIAEYRENQANARTLANINANSRAGEFMSYLQIGMEIYGNKDDALKYAMRQTAKNVKEADSKSQGVFNIFDTMFSLIAQGDIDSAGAMLERLDTDAESDELKFYGQFDREKGENKKYDALKSAFQEYLSAERNPDVADDKTKGEAYRRFLAKYRAIQRGTDWTDELTAMRQENFNAKRNKKEQTSNYDDMEQANKRLRNLLGEDKPVETKPVDLLSGVSQYAPYPGAYVPTNPYPWVSPYSNYQTR